jgi:hypothetical protein
MRYRRFGVQIQALCPSALALLGALLFTGCERQTSIEVVDGRPPVDEIEFFKVNGRLNTIGLKLEPEVRLSNVVNLALFEGLHPMLSYAEATNSLGHPTGTIPHPFWREPMPAYRTAEGELGLFTMFMASGDARPVHWELYFFPTNHSPGHFILDASVRSQAVQLVALKRPPPVLISAPGQGGIHLQMTSNRVDYMYFVR